MAIIIIVLASVVNGLCTCMVCSSRPQSLFHTHTHAHFFSHPLSIYIYRRFEFFAPDLCYVKLNRERIRSRPYDFCVCFDSCLGSTLTNIDWFVCSFGPKLKLDIIKFSMLVLSSHSFALSLCLLLPQLFSLLGTRLHPIHYIQRKFLNLKLLAYLFVYSFDFVGGFFPLSMVCVNRFSSVYSSVWLSFKRWIVVIFQWLTKKIWCERNKFTPPIITLSLSIFAASNNQSIHRSSIRFISTIFGMIFGGL